MKAACFRGESYDTMDAEAAAIPPGCDGVTMVPDFLASGDRKGSIGGLVLGRTRGHIYRAAMEALTWRLKSRLRRLESVGRVQKRIPHPGGRRSQKQRLDPDARGHPPHSREGL